MVRKCVWMMRWCAFGMHLEAREERQNLFCLTSVLHLRTDNTYADRPSSPNAYLRPFADRPSPLGEYLRAFTDHSRSFTFPKRCNSSSELIRNLFGCSVFIRLSSDDNNTNDSPVFFKRSRHWESRPPVSSQSAEDICPKKLDRSQTG